MECCVWVNREQTVLIFTRESVNDPAESGTFLSTRADPGEPWRPPQRLPGDLGDYGTYGYTDVHMTPAGNLYFWTASSGNGALYWAPAAGSLAWAPPRLLPGSFQTTLDETQPWVNDEETVIYFNRRSHDGNTSLYRAARVDTAHPWDPPVQVPVRGFADPNGYQIWGEPSFTDQGDMYVVRSNTATPDWDAELLYAPRNPDGSYGPPRKVEFRMTP